MRYSSPKSSDSDLVQQVADSLFNGAVVLFPTDTVYALAAWPENEAAVERIFALKARPFGVVLPLLISGEDDLLQLGVDMNKSVKSLLASPFVPGGLTLIMGFDPTKSRPFWLAERKEVGCRIPDDEFLRAVTAKTGPLFATSANRHGQTTPRHLDDILLQLVGEPDLVIDDGPRTEIGSTIVNCCHIPPTIQRAGPISEDELRRYFIS